MARMRRGQRPPTRTSFIALYLNLIMKNVYKKIDERLRIEMAKIAFENRALTGAYTTAFMFEGVWYTNPWNYEVQNRETKEWSRTLHPSLFEKVNGLVNGESHESKKTQEDIRQYVCEALERCRTVQCFWSILPTARDIMTPDLFDVSLLVYNEGPELSMQEVDEFKAAHPEGVKALSIIYMTEILLSGN